MTQSPLTALVTGAAGDVGSACATSLAAAGVDLFVAGRRIEPLKTLAAELGSPTCQVVPIVIDLGDPESVDHALSDPRLRSATPQILVNSAALFGPIGAVGKLDLDRWYEAFNVNFHGLVQLTNSLLPKMIEIGWGRIVQISTAAAVDSPRPFNGAYAISKMAANRFLAQVSIEVAGSGVTVHAFHPGEIRSAMWREIARACVDRPELGSLTEWASSTDSNPDDPGVVGSRVAELLDDRVATSLNGRFIWAQKPARATLDLLGEWPGGTR